MNKAKGKVFLTGAGPGDPGLLTVKALKLLESADVVVHDRLVSNEILALIPASSHHIDVGKSSGHHSLPQAEINNLLARLAQRGRRVVRLKGGDPYTFGRGSEEALHLARLGISFEVVPGITAATACAAYAGAPLTHRGLSHGVRLVTGHFQENGELELDWNGLADPDTTLVIYMGLSNAAYIRDALVAAGLDEKTPAIAVQNGTTAKHRQLNATLATLPEAIKSGEMQAPVLLIIGRSAVLANELAWFKPQQANQLESDHAPRRALHLA